MNKETATPMAHRVPVYIHFLYFDLTAWILSTVSATSGADVSSFSILVPFTAATSHWRYLEAVEIRLLVGNGW